MSDMPRMVDPPSGWRYGFPKLYDPACGLSMEEWLTKEGYPHKPEYVRQWYVGDETA